MERSARYYEDQQKIIAERVKELEKQISKEEEKNKKLKLQRKYMKEADD
jgi:RNase P subunit RPR2